MSYTGFRPGGFEISTLAELNGPSQPTFLSLPCGERSESEVAQVISMMKASAAHDRRDAGRVLDRLRDPRSGVPASLLREDGKWQRDAPRHAGYAVAVLTLAVALRDPLAEVLLPVCRNVMQRVEKRADFR
ncbi:hypothetical protein [Deinococcus ruber]|uniref:Uncharacterized protein n=1 Tax=Deinococcus ruber TaxID=1848197 RepID=A0A918CQV1_9DEIO|nr:hypothetical protein [Deinococcus ruber]GGR34052.1 hypothetical protein GCM10008957_50320 [Deinococcus ruber]